MKLQAVLTGRSLVITSAAIWALLNALVLPHAVNAKTLGELSHIHNVRVHKELILLGTHEGLYQYFSPTKVIKVEPNNFDVMGLATNQNALFASGHPGVGSKFAQPVGVLRSSDNGKSWSQLSLKGKVDFHLLEVGNSDIYGADSQTGELMYSPDLGKSWSNRGGNTYEDIAIDSSKAGAAYGLKKGQIYKSTDSLKTVKVIKSKLAFTSIELVGKSLYGASGNTFNLSTDGARTWKQVAVFDKNLSVISASEKMLLVVAGDKILISKDLGKSFN